MLLINMYLLTWTIVKTIATYSNYIIVAMPVFFFCRTVNLNNVGA